MVEVVYSINKILTGLRFGCPQRHQYEMALGSFKNCNAYVLLLY